MSTSDERVFYLRGIDRNGIVSDFVTRRYSIVRVQGVIDRDRGSDVTWLVSDDKENWYAF